jgi:transcriptional regulator GlxA family with amidase domain
MEEAMEIVVLVFEKLTALDAIGPAEVLARLPGARLRFVAPQRGVVRTDNGCTSLMVETSIDDVSACDVLVVAGGFGTRLLERDERVLQWLRAIDATTRVTASVCTGALLLGAAGLLRGRRANTHWTVRERLAQFGALPVGDRVVRDGKYATAAGVSAGIDLALQLAIELAGETTAQAIQLSIEYDPAPPLDAGSPERAPAKVREAIEATVRKRDAELAAQLG